MADSDKKSNSTLKPTRFRFHYTLVIANAAPSLPPITRKAKSPSFTSPAATLKKRKKKKKDQKERSKSSPKAANSIFNYKALCIFPDATARNPIECITAIAPSGFNCGRSNCTGLTFRLICDIGRVSSPLQSQRTTPRLHLNLFAGTILPLIK